MKKRFEIILDDDDSFSEIEMAMKGRDAFYVLWKLKQIIIESGSINKSLFFDLLIQYSINTDLIE